MAASSTDILLESRRRAYLSALGIAVYHPRKQLPGALPSSQLAMVTRSRVLQAGAERAKPDTATLATPTAPAAAQLAETLNLIAAPSPVQAPAQSSVRNPASPTRAPTRTAAQPPAPIQATSSPAAVAVEQVEAPPAFAFAFVPVNEQVAVINELPWAGSTTLTASSRQLLAGILKALTLPCEERHLSSLNFVWPLPDMPPADQGPAPVRELLKGFLAQRFRIRPVRYLLVLAEQSASYLFPAGFEQPPEGGVFRHPDFDIQVLVTHSLGAMEAVPALKREVWAALQPLLSALKHHDAAAAAGGSASQGRDAE